MFRRFCSSAIRVLNKGSVLTLEEATAGVSGEVGGHLNYNLKVRDTDPVEDQGSSYTKSFDQKKVHYVKSSYLAVVAILQEYYQVYNVDTTMWKATKEVVFGISLRCRNGKLKNVYVGSLGMGLTFNQQDFDSIFQVLIQAKENNDQLLAIIQDNINVVQMINHPKIIKIPELNRWRVKVIKMICHHVFKEVKILHSYRCGNLVAHELCNTPIPGVPVTTAITQIESHNVPSAVKILAHLDETKQEYIQILKVDP